MSKYIKAIILMHEQPLFKSNSGSCVFNNVYIEFLDNDRDCTRIRCEECIFNKSIPISNIEVISHEQTD